MQMMRKLVGGLLLPALASCATIAGHTVLEFPAAVGMHPGEVVYSIPVPEETCALEARNRLYDAFLIEGFETAGPGEGNVSIVIEEVECLATQEGGERFHIALNVRLVHQDGAVVAEKEVGRSRGREARDTGKDFMNTISSSPIKWEQSPRGAMEMAFAAVHRDLARWLIPERRVVALADVTECPVVFPHKEAEPSEWDAAKRTLVSCTETLDSGPALAGVYRNMAQVLLLQGDVEGALGAVDQALRIEPEGEAGEWYQLLRECVLRMDAAETADGNERRCHVGYEAPKGEMGWFPSS